MRIIKASTVCSRSATETLERNVNNFKHISHLALVFLFLSLTMNRFLFAGKARVHIKELANGEVTDFQLKLSSFTNIIQGFSSPCKNTCLQELNNL